MDGPVQLTTPPEHTHTHWTNILASKLSCSTLHSTPKKVLKALQKSDRNAACLVTPFWSGCTISECPEVASVLHWHTQVIQLQKEKKNSTVPFCIQRHFKSIHTDFSSEFASNVKQGQLTFLSWLRWTTLRQSRSPSNISFLKLHKNEWSWKNALAINSPLLVATRNKSGGAMNRKKERCGQNEDSFCSLTISV